MQWVIEESYTSPLPDELREDRVWHRLLIINNVSLLTTSYTIQNTILDLYSSNPAHGYVETLRDEAKQALKSTDGVWTAETVNRLPLMDSAIRESMRASPLGPLMLARTVRRLVFSLHSLANPHLGHPSRWNHIRRFRYEGRLQNFAHRSPGSCPFR